MYKLPFFSFQRKPYKLTPYKHWPAFKRHKKEWRKIYFYLCLIWLDMVGYFWLYCLSGLCQQIILWLDGVIFSVDSLTHLMVMLLGKCDMIWKKLAQFGRIFVQIFLNDYWVVISKWEIWFRIHVFLFALLFRRCQRNDFVRISYCPQFCKFDFPRIM